MNIGEVTGSMIERHLENLNLSGRTKRNHFRHINSLFKFAIRRKYLPKDALDEMAAIEKPEEDFTEIEIFSPDEMDEILRVARPEITTWLAIAGFAGLRTAELQRLDWRDVNLKERHIEVTAAKSKTASRRLVPMTENLLAWLTPQRKPPGVFLIMRICQSKLAGWFKTLTPPAKNRQRRLALIRKMRLLFKWKRNALRHSFISYRLAAIKIQRKWRWKRAIRRR